MKMTDKQKEYANRFKEKHPDYTREYYKEYCKKNPDYRKNYYLAWKLLHNLPTRLTQTPEQRSSMNRIRWRTIRYLKSRGIAKPCCQLCGEIKTQIHHPDREDVYLVNFLCKKCHDDVTWRCEEAPQPIDIRLMK